MIMDLHTDFPERLRSGRKLFVGDEHKPMTLSGVRPHAKGVLVKLKGIETPEDAGLFRNQWVYVRTTDVPALPEGKIYQHELFGFKVVDETDRPLGELVEIIETGANNVYVVKDESGKEILLPAIPSVILELDADRRLMRVHLLEGL
jgi:16S rRNA processing protein RimM